MSDPYSPYQPPTGYGGYPPQGVYARPPTGPAMPGIVRASAIALAVIGGLIVVGSVLAAIVTANIPIEMLEEAGALEGVPPDFDVQTALTVGASCLGACGGALGLLYLVMSPFVWRGGRGTIVVSAVLVGVTLVGVLLLVAVALVQGGPQAVLGSLFYLLGAIILGILLFLLIRSLGALRERDMQAMAAYQMTWPGYPAPQQMQWTQAQAPPPGQEPPQQSGPQQGTGWDQEPRA